MQLLCLKHLQFKVSSSTHYVTFDLHLSTSPLSVPLTFYIIIAQDNICHVTILSSATQRFDCGSQS